MRTTDLALAPLPARWPGVLKKLEDEADRWAAQGWNEVDTTFLTRALTGAVLGRGLSKWSHALSSDVTVGDESVPAYMEGDELQIRMGEFLATETLESWRKVLDREITDARPLSQAPVVHTEIWEDEPVAFPVTSIE